MNAYEFEDSAREKLPIFLARRMDAAEFERRSKQGWRRVLAVLVGTACGVKTYRAIVENVRLPIVKYAVAVIVGAVAFGAGAGLALLALIMVPVGVTPRRSTQGEH